MIEKKRKGRLCIILTTLDKPRFLESCKRPSFLHRLQTLCRDVDRDFPAELRDKKRLFLHIHLTAALARRVKFGRTGAVGISTPYARSLTSYVADFCHTLF